jgi:hypothetical protein
MEIILHIGAHRTATTTFQAYLRDNAGPLAAHGIVAWEPWTTRHGLFAGINPAPGARGGGHRMRRARARLSERVAAARAQGARRIVVSDENMSGDPGDVWQPGPFYPDIARRMARFAAAFDRPVARVVLSVRPQDAFWRSMLTYRVTRGMEIPPTARLSALAEAGHSWRDVIRALSAALPDTEIRVLRHEPYAARPDLRLARMIARPPDAGRDLPRADRDTRRNASPELPRLRGLSAARGGRAARLPEGPGRWSPLELRQLCRLHEAWGHDLDWLRAGADGLATLIEETGPARQGANPAAAQMTRGHGDGIEKGRMA